MAGLSDPSGSPQSCPAVVSEGAGSCRQEACTFTQRCVYSDFITHAGLVPTSNPSASSVSSSSGLSPTSDTLTHTQYITLSSLVHLNVRLNAAGVLGIHPPPPSPSFINLSSPPSVLNPGGTAALFAALLASLLWS